MQYKHLIERNHQVMQGKPIIKGTRITVELIIRKFANGYSLEQMLEAYPSLNKTQIQAAMEYAADVIANEETIEAA
ncbi:MAG: hypothetical protein RI955_97 [Bacteroidota bacterium]|jgi:uncharacterized protein (DUF433 family)